MQKIHSEMNVCEDNDPKIEHHRQDCFSKASMLLNNAFKDKRGFFVFVVGKDKENTIEGSGMARPSEILMMADAAEDLADEHRPSNPIEALFQELARRAPTEGCDCPNCTDKRDASKGDHTNGN